jgi:elongation factor P
MATVSGGNIRKGQYIIYNGQPHSVLWHEFVSPGKGSAFTRAKLRNIISGKVFDFTFKTTETVELADVESIELQYLYFDGSSYLFMNPRSYEQVEVPVEVMDDQKKFLKEEMLVYVQMYNGNPIGVYLPNKITLAVVDAEDAVAGDRVTAPKKQATVETGAIVMVPIFVKKGDHIIVDTATGEYVSRSNE